MNRLLALLPVAILGCSSSHAAMQPPPAPAPAPAASQQVDRPAIAEARADSARYPYTAADVHFMSSMIGHHAQAIVMSKWAESHGASESVRTLAARIINAQQDEIRGMQQWLRDRQQPVPEAHTMAMPMDSTELMPGMLTDAQMAQLDAARGPAFDRLFVTFMLQHHRGAITMVDQLLASPGAAQDVTVFRISSGINADQTTEIGRMEKMLFTMDTTSPKQ